MRIGLDLDGVVYDYTDALRQRAALHYDMSPDSMEDPIHWDLHEDPSWPFGNREEFLGFHIQEVEEGLFATMSLLPGVANAITRMSACGHQIVVITSRLLGQPTQYVKAVSDTILSLHSYGISYESIHFTPHKTTVDCDVMFEDSPSNIEALQRFCRPVAVVSHAYNHRVPGPRLQHWDDLIVTPNAIGFYDRSLDETYFLSPTTYGANGGWVKV
jgi:5'(3')-deoxyribonucleotidase